MRRYGLRDDQWERIEHLLPGKEGDPGATDKTARNFLGAIYLAAAVIWLN